MQFDDQPVWDQFSPAYTSIVLFLVVVAVCSKKDLNIFIKMGSFGALFVTTLILFIAGTGVLELTRTNYEVGSPKQADNTDWANDDSTRTIMLYNSQFANLAGMLGCGYFLHTCAPNITRTAMYPEKNKRNLMAGYSLVLMTYIIVGIMGYIGFIGTNFTYYYQNQKPDASDYGVINQNCLNMFKYDSIPAWFLRLAIFCCLFSTYPLINHFTKTILKNLIWSDKEVARYKEILLNVILAIVPLLFALFYPNVGVITTYVGSVAGFLLIYLLPVLVHLKRMRLRIKGTSLPN